MTADTTAEHTDYPALKPTIHTQVSRLGWWENTAAPRASFVVHGVNLKPDEGVYSNVSEDDSKIYTTSVEWGDNQRLSIRHSYNEGLGFWVPIFISGTEDIDLVATPYGLNTINIGLNSRRVQHGTDGLYRLPQGTRNVLASSSPIMDMVERIESMAVHALGKQICTRITLRNEQNATCSYYHVANFYNHYKRPSTVQTFCVQLNPGWRWERLNTEDNPVVTLARCGACVMPLSPDYYILAPGAAPDELHAFAVSLGLKREWFQDHRSHPHYDLKITNRGKRTMRQKAIALGAVDSDQESYIKKKNERWKLIAMLNDDPALLDWLFKWQHQLVTGR